MFTGKAISGGPTYAANHLSNNDYYSVGDTVTGRWMGQGARLLGLEGEVTMQAFDAIRLGKDPKTGEYLRERQNVDRYSLVERDGVQQVEKVATARNLYDFTLSAPKDVSIMAMVDARLHQAHEAGLKAAFVEMERLAGAGVRADGAHFTRRTSNLVIARYDHDTSRALDPQDHSHLVAGNLTYDAVEGKWKALDAQEIYKQAALITEAYRNGAAAFVMDCGHEIKNLSEKGKDNGFGIVGITDETREKFSQRSEQRDAAIASFIEANGRYPSKNEIARLVRDTRDPKLQEISSADVKAGQLARLEPYELRTLTRLRDEALARGSIREYAQASPSLAYATEHIFERNSVAKDYEIKAEALVHGRGRIDLAELKGELQAQIAMGHILTARARAGSNVATEASLERERRMVATVDQGIGKYEPLGRGVAFVPSARLRTEQKVAVRGALASEDLVFNIKGAAGVGKTNLLEDVHRGLTEARRSVMAVGPSASSVDELRKVGFPEAITISRLLVDPQKQQDLAGQVLLIDEAGMVGSKEMDELLTLAQSKGARMLTVGDTRQIKSVLEGDALRVLERESSLKSVSLLEVQRQSNVEYKAAVIALRENPSKGYELLEKMGAIREVDWRLVGKETSKAYREAMAVPNRKGQARSVLVVAGTHDQIRSITHAIRTDRKAAGELLDGQNFTKHSALNWTEAQRKQMNRYQAGQVLVFHKAVKGVAKNEALEVVSADKHSVSARHANGGEIAITSRHVKAFGVFEREQVEVSPNDKLLFQSNWRDKNFRATNGELVTVASVENGTIKLDDGRQLPAAYRQFSHGYAVTAHVSQGKSQDWVIPVVDGMREDLAYVSLTRGREGITIVTSDKTAFEASLSMSGDRQSATELARQAAVGSPAQPLPGEDLMQIYRAQEGARQLSQKLAQQEQIHHKQEIEHVNESSYEISMGI